MEPPFQGEPKMYLRTLKAEKQAACLKCKSNLPTLTVRGLKPEGRHSLEVYACYTIQILHQLIIAITQCSRSYVVVIRQR